MITVIACTNRKDFVQSIIDNFQKQTLVEKELILILHSLNINIDSKEHTVLHLPGEMSLGECLNQGVKHAKFQYIAKMDDDDYYGPDYLKEAYDTLTQTNADLVGKSSFYIYFKNNQELRLYNPNFEKKWIANNGPYQSSFFLSGATMVFRKCIFSRVRFPDVNIGEDSGFQKLCYENGMKIYALSKDHYAYLRYPDSLHHHSDVKEPLLKRRSRFIANVPSIEAFINHQNH